MVFRSLPSPPTLSRFEARERDSPSAFMDSLSRTSKREREGPKVKPWEGEG
jgi:hypothetical protein